ESQPQQDGVLRRDDLGRDDVPVFRRRGRQGCRHRQYSPGWRVWAAREITRFTEIQPGRNLKMRKTMKALFALLCLGGCAWGQEGTGAFPATMEQDPGLPTHTVYRPKDLSKLQGQKLPIIAWGNGACVNNGTSYRNFLTEIASHGFLAIAIGPPQASPV